MNTASDTTREPSRSPDSLTLKDRVNDWLSGYRHLFEDREVDLHQIEFALTEDEKYRVDNSSTNKGSPVEKLQAQYEKAIHDVERFIQATRDILTDTTRDVQDRMEAIRQRVAGLQNA